MSEDNVIKIVIIVLISLLVLLIITGFMVWFLKSKKKNNINQVKELFDLVRTLEPDRAYAI